MKKKRGDNVTLNFIVGEIPVRLLSSWRKCGKGHDVMLYIYRAEFLLGSQNKQRPQKRSSHSL